MATEKRRAFIINVLYILLWAGMVYVVLRYCLGFIAPFLIGFLIARVLKRPIMYLNRKTPLPYKTCAILLVAAFYLAVVWLLTALSTGALSTVRNLLPTIPEFYAGNIEPVLITLLDFLQQQADKLDMSIFPIGDTWRVQIVEPLSKMVANLSKNALGLVSGAATSLPGFFIRLLMTIISSFFIAADYPTLSAFVYAQLSEKAQHLFVEIKLYIVGTLLVCLRSYLIIMFITFVELSIGLTILGVGTPVLIAAVIAVCDILPILGTGTVLIPWTLVSALWGHYPRAIGLFLVYLTITIIRNIIEPKIVGGQLGLHPVVTLFSMFVGARLFGILGLFGFPVILSLLCYLNSDGTISLFKQPQREPAEEKPQFDWKKLLALKDKIRPKK